MIHKSKTFVLCVAFLAVAGGTASALLIFRTRVDSGVTPTVVASQPPHARTRNLFVQPEAVKMSRLLGKRFGASSRAAFVLAGTLTTQEGQQPIRIIRRQTDGGENLQIVLPHRALKWSDQEGVTALSGDAPTPVERLLVERFAFDSPDQFILAQLRGASYQIVARNARPVEVGASENYTGPIWDLVRVTDSEQDAHKRPLSPSRLYYINSNTGLIDKIIYDISDQRMEVLLSDWNVVSGENVPTRIVWKYKAQTLMQFTLNTFTPEPQQ